MTTTQDKFQVSIFAKPDEVMRCQYFDRGHYHNWLVHEMHRWEDTGREAWIEQNQEQVVLADGYVAEKGEAVALFTWAKGMRPVGPEEL